MRKTWIVWFSVACCALVVVLSPSARAAISDDFQDNDDAGWTHHDSTSSASFSVTGSYLILVPDSVSDLAVGSQRHGALESFSDVVVSVDMTGWNDGDERYYGIGAGQTDGVGGDYFKGYALAYVNESASTKLQLLRFSSLSSWGPIASTPLTLDPDEHYRLVLQITGTSPKAFTAKVFAASAPATPLASFSTVDLTPPIVTAGYAGIAIADLSNSVSGSISAGFDDFFASAPTDDTDFDGLSDGDELLLHGTKPLVQDTDLDGVSDGAEVNAYSSDPLDPDTDDDELTDGYEVNVLGTDPTDADTDDDGLPDNSELSYSTDPLDPDSDNDGMTDGFEVTNGFLPTNPADAAQDPDADGLTNLAEQTAGTNPHDADSDDDGGLDGVEVSLGTNPLAFTPFPFPLLAGPAALNINAGTDSGNDFAPQLTSDGAGNWVAVWYSTDTLGGTIGTDNDILVSRSTNNGATWTAPAALNTNAGTDSGHDFNPQVTTNGSGNWVAVWYSNDTLGFTIGTDNDILVSRSTNNGATWTAPAALNTNAGTDSGHDLSPQVTTDGSGNWVVVWQSADTLGGTIGTDYDMLVSRSTNNGLTWTAPVALNTNAGTDSSWDALPQVTTDGSGSWVAVWESNDTLGGTIGTDFDILVSRSTNNGATWTAPAALNTNAGTDTGADSSAQVTANGVGSWVAVWYSNDTLGGTLGTDNDILVSRSTNNGATWTAPAALNTNAGTDTGGDLSPQVTTDGSGSWVAVWYSNDTLGGTIGTDNDILVSRSTNDGATWTPPTALNANAGTDTGGDLVPQVTTDGSGSWIAVWNSNDTLGGTIGTDYDILFTTSGSDTDGDGLADGVEVLIGSNHLVADSDGDGLSDGVEFSLHRTDPNDADTDGDSYSDGIEVLAGTDPLDPQDFPPPPPPVPVSGPWGIGVLAALLMVLGQRRLRPGLLAR